MQNNNEIRLKRHLSMPTTEINTFIANSDTLGAVAKGIYLTLLANIVIAEHFNRKIDAPMLSANFHKVSESQITEALMTLAQEGLLYRDECGEWYVNTFDNRRDSIEIQKLEALFSENR